MLSRFELCCLAPPLPFHLAHWLCRHSPFFNSMPILCYIHLLFLFLLHLVSVGSSGNDDEVSRASDSSPRLNGHVPTIYPIVE